MKQLSRRVGASLVAGLQLACGAAMAAASSSATISNLQFQVIDLDPFDGVSAAITFDNQDPQGLCAQDVLRCPGWTTVRLRQTTPLLDQTVSAGRATTWAPNGSTLATPYVGASASVSSGAGSLALSASGSASGTPGSDPTDNSSFIAVAGVSSRVGFASFTLTRNTLLVVTAGLTVESRTTRTGTYFDPYDQLDRPIEGASASLLLSIELPGATGTKDGQTSALFSIGNSSYDGTLHSDSLGASAWFANTTADALTGYFNAQAIATGYSHVQVVPEPGRAGLLAVGLVALASLVRRRGARR